MPTEETDEKAAEAGLEVETMTLKLLTSYGPMLERYVVAQERLAKAQEEANLLQGRFLVMAEADHQMHAQAEEDHDKIHANFEESRQRRQAAMRLLVRKIVQPVFEKFMSEGGLALLQSILTGQEIKS